MKRFRILMRTLSVLIAFCSINSFVYGQLTKTQLRDIEKNAQAIPGDTFRIGLESIDFEHLLDSNFGGLVVNNQGAWNNYRVNLGEAVPSYIPSFDFETQFPFDFIQVEVKPIYMSRFETSNADYQVFQKWMKINSPDSLYKISLDTFAWNKLPEVHSAPFAQYYHVHPAFLNYPLVNVSHIQAEAYLQWLTDQYNQSPNRKYQKVLFRLPTEEEWIFASLGGETLRKTINRINSNDAKGRKTANYYSPLETELMKLQLGDDLRFNDSSMNPKYTQTITYLTDDDTLIYWLKKEPDYFITGKKNFSNRYHENYTLPIKSFEMNAYGLYNMHGNIAEFVSLPGICKGGHWNTTAYYLMPLSRETYFPLPSASPTRGFRWVMEVIEE